MRNWLASHLEPQLPECGMRQSGDRAQPDCLALESEGCGSNLHGISHTLLPKSDEREREPRYVITVLEETP